MKTVIKFLKLPFHFSAADMKAETEEIAAGWKLHYNTNDYTGDWSAVPLRSAGGSLESVVAFSTGTTFADTVLMDECSYIKSVVQSFKCPLQSVRLLRLKAGSVIKEHTDPDLCFEQGEARIHIPVQTHDDVAFYLDGERLQMGEGECWYTNVNLPHRISNNSNTDRIHMVLDCVVNDWLRDVFAANAANARMAEIKERIMSDEEKQGMIAALKALGTPTALQIASEMDRS